MFIAHYSDPDITLGQWDCTNPDPSWSPAEHVHQYEMVVPVEGCLVRERLGKVAIGTPNSALFANPGDTYRFRHPAATPDRCALVLLSEQAMEDMARITRTGLSTSGDPAFHAGDCNLGPVPFFTLRRLIARASLPHTLDRLRVKESIGSIFLAAIASAHPMAAAQPAAGATGSRQRRAVHRAMAFMASSYRERLTLDRVAQEAAYSPFHFARVFRRHTGLTVHGYLTRIRLRHAVGALLQGESNLSRLALRVGFASHSHFSDAFRRQYGLTPSQVRDPRALTDSANSSPSP